MHPFPHIYTASAQARGDTPSSVSSPDLPSLETAPPPQFGGPGGLWSPETLLCASLADCFVLTFRSLCRATRFEWLELRCDVEGTLERENGQSRFTQFHTRARLTVAPGSDLERAGRLLEKAEQGCLIVRSLSGTCHLSSDVVIASP